MGNSFGKRQHFRCDRVTCFLGAKRKPYQGSAMRKFHHLCRLVRGRRMLICQQQVATQCLRGLSVRSVGFVGPSVVTFVGL